MKISLTTVAVLGGLASYTQAAPVRLWVITSTPPDIAAGLGRDADALPFRVGHAGGLASSSAPPEIKLALPHSQEHSDDVRDSENEEGMFRIMPHPPVVALGGSHMKAPCGRGKGPMSLSAKMLQLSNRIRLGLGLPLIDFHHPRHRDGGRKVLWTETHDGVTTSFVTYNGPRHHRHPHHHRHSANGEEPFAARFERALTKLTPFEAGMVAFVFGCGLGALLRIVIVMSILFVRALRCNSSTRRQADASVSAAPPYEHEDLPAYRDEKVAILLVEKDSTVDEPTI